MPTHFAVPFTVSGGQVTTTDDSSRQEIIDAVKNLLRTERKALEWLPDFGRPDWAFQLAGLDPDDIRDLVERWEPRAALDITTSDVVAAAITQIDIEDRHSD